MDVQDEKRKSKGNLGIREKGVTHFNTKTHEHKYNGNNKILKKQTN